MQILLHLYLCPQNPTHGLCPHGLCPKVEDTTHVSPLRSLSATYPAPKNPYTNENTTTAASERASPQSASIAAADMNLTLQLSLYYFLSLLILSLANIRVFCPAPSLGTLRHGSVTRWFNLSSDFLHNSIKTQYLIVAIIFHRIKRRV